MAGIAARILAFGELHFDADASLLELPITSYRNAHVAHLPPDALRHPVRESLYYALALLASDKPEAVARAARILDRITRLQCRSGPHSGLWPYFAEESVAQAPSVDINWADFIGMGLAVCVQRYASALPADLVGRCVAAVVSAADFIRRRNVDLEYTNVAMKGTFVVLVAAELSDDAPGMRDYASDRFARLRSLILSQPIPAEYNSPAYAGVCLVAAHAIEELVHDPHVRDGATRIVGHLWGQVVARFHAPSGELAGPHARAYAPTLAELPGWLGPLIEYATDGLHSYLAAGDELFAAVWPMVLSPRVPRQATLGLTKAVVSPRVESSVVVASPHIERRLTTWLTPTFAIGSISFQDGWEQRQNLIACWRSAAGRVAFARHRYMHDGRACCSGFFTSSQHRGSVSVGAFLGAGADEHILRPVDGVEAAFLGAVLEVDGRGDAVDLMINGITLSADVPRVEVQVGDEILLTLRAVDMEMAMEIESHDVAPGIVPPARVERQAFDRIRLMLPHYDGPRRPLRWTDFHRAASAYRLRVKTGDALEESSIPSAPLPPELLTTAQLELWAGSV
ncbi:MAG: hypothetical protein QM626_03170 [Microbacterium sp.]|uniref:hypothetical protein n=1 Tax=Microbacterium sp. TaxID=51671 RepID=UPI0039E3F2FA